MGKVKTVTLKEAFAPISEAIKAGRSVDDVLSVLDQMKQSMYSGKVLLADNDATKPFIEAIESADKLIEKEEAIKVQAFGPHVTEGSKKGDSFEEQAAKIAENMGLKEYTLEYSDGEKKVVQTEEYKKAYADTWKGRIEQAAKEMGITM